MNAYKKNMIGGGVLLILGILAWLCGMPLPGAGEHASAAVTAVPAQTAAASSSPAASAAAASTASSVRSPEPAMSVMDAPIEQKITRKGLIYEYTGTHAHLIGCTDTAKRKKTIKIPAKICVQDIYYDVTVIDCEAFQGCAKLRKVSIGRYVRQIRYGAFQENRKLRRVIFRGRKLKNVGDRAFWHTASGIRFRIPSRVFSKYQKLLKQSGPKRAVYRSWRMP